jgi:chemotaxis protein CheX
MTSDTTLATRSREENWLPILELAVEEVFEVMVGSRVKPVAHSGVKPREEFTAIVGLAGALCGILTVCCDAKTAHRVTKCMLGDTADTEEQVVDALGEICNMITGNFKNKLTGTDDRCMLSVPTVISGGEHSFHSLADGNFLETVLLFEGAPIAVRLQLNK